MGRLVTALVLAGGATLVMGCDGPSPAPVADRFQPSRPTNAGSLADAVRRAPARVLGGQGTPSPSPAPVDVPAELPVRLDDPTRQTVTEYLDTMGRLNAALASLSDPAQASEVEQRVSPLVDAWRGSMDYLQMMPESVQREIRKEFGPGLSAASNALAANMRRLADQPAYGPIRTLVGDVPVLGGVEPTPAPLALPQRSPQEPGTSTASTSPDRGP